MTTTTDLPRPLRHDPAVRPAIHYDAARVRARFPLLAAGDRTGDKAGAKPLAYLDSAATSQKPDLVLDALVAYYRESYGAIARGVYALSAEATRLYEAARDQAARFLGAAASEEIVFTRGTTEAINLVASSWGRANLAPGDEILVTGLEHHSNLVPWQLVAQATGARVRYLPIAEDGTLDLSGLDGLLTERTKVVAVTGQSNVLGTLPPIKFLAEAVHAVGAVIVVDGAQLVPHNPVDVLDLGIDFLTISGHKMLGPTASGGLYGKRELLERMDPFLGGGEMIMEVFPDRSTFKDPPHKFEAGTMNIG
ncbi:MAG: aminotransferase class V-fold PLP-dependent enzyme, partial [Myxococcota bacterium]